MITITKILFALLLLCLLQENQVAPRPFQGRQQRPYAIPRDLGFQWVRLIPGGGIWIPLPGIGLPNTPAPTTTEAPTEEPVIMHLFETLVAATLPSTNNTSNSGAVVAKNLPGDS